MFQRFSTLPSASRDKFDNPWEELSFIQSSAGVRVPPPHLITDLMNWLLMSLGQHDNCSGLNVKRITHAVMADFTSHVMNCVPEVTTLIIFNPSIWTNVLKAWCHAAIKLLANSGFLKLSDPKNFEDSGFVCYHASAQLRYENGRYVQKTLLQTMKDLHNQHVKIPQE